MLEELWSKYGWIGLVIALVGFNILCCIPTKKYISGFHRGVNFCRKETYGDIIIAIFFIIQLGFIIWLLVKMAINSVA